MAWWLMFGIKIVRGGFNFEPWLPDVAQVFARDDGLFSARDCAEVNLSVDDIWAKPVVTSFTIGDLWQNESKTFLIRLSQAKRLFEKQEISFIIKPLLKEITFSVVSCNYLIDAEKMNWVIPDSSARRCGFLAFVHQEAWRFFRLS